MTYLIAHLVCSGPSPTGLYTVRLWRLSVGLPHLPRWSCGPLVPVTGGLLPDQHLSRRPWVCARPGPAAVVCRREVPSDEVVPVTARLGMLALWKWPSMSGGIALCQVVCYLTDRHGLILGLA